MKRFVYSLIMSEGNKPFHLLYRPLLLFLSFIYVNIINLVKFFYKINLSRSVRPKSKVISIGNITWGGTGKTSLVALLSRFLTAKDKRPAVLIRGYGADEDRMLTEQIDAKVLSGRNRLKNAKIAEDEYNADVLILDDGFQHWRIKRDLDIVTINAASPFGNGRIIPAGILREPLPALKRADIIMLTKVNLVDKEDVSKIKNIILDIAPEAKVFEAEYQAVSLTETSENKELSLNYIIGKKVCAVAAIGDNDSFFKMLLNLGAEIKAKFSFLDHHKYTQRDIKDILSAAKYANSEAIITTAKDWIRLKETGLTLPVLILNITAKIKDEEIFFDSIGKYLSLPKLSKKGF